MARRAEIRVASTLAAEPAAVWERAMSAEGIGSQRRWHHARTLAVGGEGTVLIDRVAWEPRLPIPAAVLRPLFAAVFGYRHRRLRRWFGGAALPR